MARYAILDTTGVLVGVNLVAPTPLEAAIGVLDQALEEVASLQPDEDGFSVYSLPTSITGRMSAEMVVAQGSLEAWVRAEQHTASSAHETGG